MDFNRTGLINYWPLSGDTLDHTSTQQDGVYTVANVASPGSETYTDGVAGRALLFPQVSQTYVDCGTVDCIVQQAFSITAWFRLDSSPAGGYTIVSKASSSSVAGALWFIDCTNGTGSNRVRIGGWNGSVDTQSNAILTLGTWYHVAVAYTGSRLQMYVNGVVDVDNPLVLDVPIDNRLRCVIGSFAQSSYRPFHGPLQQITLWNRAVTSSEAAAMYNGGLGVASLGRLLPGSNATSNYMQTDASPTALGLTGTGSKSMSLWIRPDNYTGSGGVFDSGTQALGRNWGMHVAESVDNWQFQGWGLASNFTWNYGSIGAWSHFVLAYDGVNTMTVYADGQLLSTEVLATPLDTGNDNAMSFGVNKFSDGLFMGSILDVRSYNRELDPREVETLFNARGRDSLVFGQTGRWFPPGETSWLHPQTTSLVPSILGSFNSHSTATFPPPVGSNRVLVIFPYRHASSSDIATSVTYGGQAATKVVEITHGATSSYVYASAWIMFEDQIQLIANSTVSITYSPNSAYGTGYQYVFINNVSQNPTSALYDNTRSIADGRGSTQAFYDVLFENFFTQTNSIVLTLTNAGSAGSISVTAGPHNAGITSGAQSGSSVLGFSSWYVAPNQTDRLTTRYEGNYRIAGVAVILEPVVGETSDHASNRRVTALGKMLPTVTEF